MAVSPPHTFISPHIFYSHIVSPPFYLHSHFFCHLTLRTSIPPFCPSVCICRSASIRQHVQHFFPCWFFPTFLLLLLLRSSSRFRMCARVRGARHCVRPNGLKVNAYVIANCLQSLGAALKKDRPRRQLRLFAFASLSDCICFKGFVRIIFNPTAL